MSSPEPAAAADATAAAEAATAVAAAHVREVATASGPVRGQVLTNEHGVFYKFKGIPYATPPIGRLRFMPPTPIKPWKDVQDYTQNAPQPFRTSSGIICDSEDCLYLDISTPRTDAHELMPVMFWIGGYAFSRSFCLSIDPSLMNNEGVIFVKCGYRKGPFGFLSINDITAPGNNGLKDIVMALKWVQTNIRAFGGDPSNVTLFGDCSGGMCIHLLMASPMAAGLFHKAVMQSAIALSTWALAKNPLQPVAELAKELGITSPCKVEIVDELRRVPAPRLMDAFCKLQRAHGGGDYDAFFKPCIETEFEGQPAFLTKSPALIIKSGKFNKVPIIIGSNNIEATMPRFLASDFAANYEKYNENLSLIAPRELALGDSKEANSIGRQLLRFYLDGEERLSEHSHRRYLRLVSDYYFAYFVNKTVRLHAAVARECPVYYYVQNWGGEWRIPAELQMPEWQGLCAEVPLLFVMREPSGRAVAGCRDSRALRAKLVRLWTNFAKFGNPTPCADDVLLQTSWPAVDGPDRLHYLSVGTAAAAELTVGCNPFRERMAFWEDLHDQHTFMRSRVHFNDIGVQW